MSAKPASAAVVPQWYGAFELKRYYQKSMTLGVGIASAFMLIVIGSVLVYQYIKEHSGTPEAVAVVRIQTLADIAPPSTGIPKPVPDEEVIEEVRFATRAELAELSAPVVAASSGNEGDSVVVDIPLEEYFPTADEFVAVEEMPVEIRHEDPIYPEMAELTEKSGIVWVQALVDKEGRVRDARVLKPSGTNVGFEEAALEAAYKNLYRPAIQNGSPVPVWVSYKVEFKFRR